MFEVFEIISNIVGWLFFAIVCAAFLVMLGACAIATLRLWADEP